MKEKWKMSVKLSVAIVAYNNYDDIKAAVSSMEKWTDKNLNKIVYIIDNGVSVSKSEDIRKFKKFIEDMNDVEYIATNGNLGFGKGQNQVISKINSEYHAIVNPDIIFCEDAFSSIIEWMDKNTDVGMVIPYIIDENGIKQDVYRKELTVFDMFNRMFLKNAFRRRAKKHTMNDMDYSKPFQVPFGQGSFLVIRSRLFKELGGFDDNFFMYVEDADLCMRVNQVSKLMYFPGTKVIHKWEKGSHKNIKLFKYHIKSIRYYFKKWGIKFY